MLRLGFNLENYEKKGKFHFLEYTPEKVKTLLEEGGGIIETVKKFDDAVGIDGIILTKVDVDEKGGAFVGVEYSCKKPILFISKGQEYKDFENFDKEIEKESFDINAKVELPIPTSRIFLPAKSFPVFAL